jgi:hypothetical protein
MLRNRDGSATLEALLDGGWPDGPVGAGGLDRRAGVARAVGFDHIEYEADLTHTPDVAVLLVTAWPKYAEVPGLLERRDLPVVEDWLERKVGARRKPIRVAVRL